LVHKITVAQKDFAAIKDVKEENREDFIQRIINECVEKIRSNKKVLSEIFSSLNNFEE
jgi:mannose/fructose-specific phosphotransferase system component IIA